MDIQFVKSFSTTDSVLEKEKSTRKENYLQMAKVLEPVLKIT